MAPSGPAENDDDRKRHLMKRSAMAIGAGAIAVSAVAIPVGAVVINQQTQDSVAVENAKAGSPDAQASTSNAALAGTGAAFLLLGAGTLGFAHRRRWATVDGPGAPSTSTEDTVTPTL